MGTVTKNKESEIEMALAFAKAQVTEQKLVQLLSVRSNQPEAGDVYQFSVDTAGLFVNWVLLGNDPHCPELFCAVPITYALPMVGPTDLQHYDCVGIEGVARVGHGVHLCREQLAFGKRFSYLCPDVLRRLRSKMGHMVAGTLLPSEEERSCVDDPEYEEVLDRLAQANHNLASSLERKLQG